MELLNQLLCGGFLVVQKHVTTCYNFPVESDLRVSALAMQSGLDMVATHVTIFGYFAINSWHVIVGYMMLHGLYIMICGYDCDLQQVLNKFFGSFLGDHHTWRFVATGIRPTILPSLAMEKVYLPGSHRSILYHLARYRTLYIEHHNIFEDTLYILQ